MIRNRLTIAGVTAGLVFGAGLIAAITVPGLGGTSTTKSFNEYYGSSQHRGIGALLGFVLMIGTWLMIWMFTELRARLARSVRADMAHLLAVIGCAAAMIGVAIELGPTMAQNTTDNGGFVGIPVAHALAQAGAGTLIMGLLTCGVAVFLFGLEFRAAAGVPRWLGPVSLVVGVLLIGSLFLAPAFLLPLWSILVGVGAGRGLTVPATRGEPAGSDGAAGTPALAGQAAR